MTEPRLTTMKERAREHKKEKRKQALTERQEWNRWLNGELHTLPEARKAWAGKRFDDDSARGVIEEWRWASTERQFVIPMTKPALSADQQCMALHAFFEWDYKQPVSGQQRDFRRDLVSSIGSKCEQTTVRRNMRSLFLGCLSA